MKIADRKINELIAANPEHQALLQEAFLLGKQSILIETDPILEAVLHIMYSQINPKIGVVPHIHDVPMVVG
jgi:hypothetical protein